jgi:hypothetical protein
MHQVLLALPPNIHISRQPLPAQTPSPASLHTSLQMSLLASTFIPSKPFLQTMAKVVFQKCTLHSLTLLLKTQHASNNIHCLPIQPNQTSTSWTSLLTTCCASATTLVPLHLLSSSTNPWDGYLLWHTSLTSPIWRKSPSSPLTSNDITQVYLFPCTYHQSVERGPWGETAQIEVLTLDKSLLSVTFCNLWNGDSESTYLIILLQSRNSHNSMTPGPNEPRKY